MNKVTVPIFGQDPSAGHGSDSGDEPRLGQSRWIIAENATFPRRNAVTKRRGFTRSASPETADSIIAPASVPLLAGGDVLKAYDPDVDDTTVVNGLQTAQIVTSLIQRFRASYVDGSFYGLTDMWDGGAWCGVLRADSTVPGLVCETYDWTTGALLDSETVGAFSTYYPQGRFITIGTATSLIVAHGTALERRDISADGTIGAAAEIDADSAMSTWVFLDVCTVGTRIAILHFTGTVWRVTLSGVAGAATYTNADIDTPTSPRSCALWAHSTTQLVVCYSDVASGTNYLYAGMINVPDLDSYRSPVTVDSVTAADYAILHVTGIESVQSGVTKASRIYWSTVSLAGSYTTTNPPTLHQATLGVTITDCEITGEVTSLGIQLCTKPAHTDTTKESVIIGVYAQTWTTGTSGISTYNFPQATLFLLRGTQIIGRSLIGLARINRIVPVSLADPQSVGTLLAGLQEVAEVIDGSHVEESRNVCAIRYKLNAGNSVAALKLGDSVLLGGQLPYLVSGASIVPVGYLWYPDNFAIVTSGNTGDLTVGKTYRFRLIWEYYDALGRLHWSTPTPDPVEYTPTAASETKPTLTALAPASDPRSTLVAVVYRTEGDKTTYHRTTWAYHTNGAVSISITGTDASISDNEILYTDDGSLEIQPPPPFAAGCLHKNRFFVAMLERPYEVRYSLDLNALEAPGFNEALSIRVPDTGGSIVALEAAGGVLYALCESAVWAIEGEPAGGDGVGATFTHAFKLEGAPGCKSFKSVISTPVGIMYQAQDGALWILTGGQAAPIGDRVRYHTDTYGTVIGSALLKTQHVAVFALSGAGAPLLVYDWLHDEWAQWTTRSDTTAICAASDTLLRLDTSGYIWRLTTDSWADTDTAARYVPLHLRTGHIFKGSIPGGWQRVHEILVGGYKHGVKDFDVSVGVAINGEPSFTTVTKSVSALTGFGHEASYGAGSATYVGEGLALRYQPVMTAQRCASMMIDITDAEGDDGAQQGYTLTDVALVVSPATGLRRVGQDRHITGE